MISTQDVEQNLETIERLLAEHGSSFDLLVLPENFALMSADDSVKLNIAEQLGEGRIQDFIKKIAAQYQAWVVAGTIPIQSEFDNKVYAACLTYNDQGQHVGTYYKQCLFDVTLKNNERYFESDIFAQGKQACKVIDSPFGRIGIAICYDLRFAEHFVQLAQQEVDLIFVPAAFTFQTGQHHWLPLLQARAIEMQSYVIGCDQGGMHDCGRRTYGHSAVYDPYGKLLVSAEEGEQLITTQIDLNYIQSVRKGMPMQVMRTNLLNAFG